MANPEIVKMLVLSTAHLTSDTCSNYMREGDVVAFEKGDYGWFVYTGNANGNHPADLEACLNHAAAYDCPWVMFDCDASTVPNLPTYEW